MLRFAVRSGCSGLCVMLSAKDMLYCFIAIFPSYVAINTNNLLFPPVERKLIKLLSLYKQQNKITQIFIAFFSRSCDTRTAPLPALRRTENGTHDRYVE